MANQGIKAGFWSNYSENHWEECKPSPVYGTVRCVLAVQERGRKESARCHTGPLHINTKSAALERQNAIARQTASLRDRLSMVTPTRTL